MHHFPVDCRLFSFVYEQNMSVFVRFTAKDVATLMATSMIVKGEMLSYLVMTFGVYKLMVCHERAIQVWIF